MTYNDSTVNMNNLRYGIVLCSPSKVLSKTSFSHLNDFLLRSSEACCGILQNAAMNGSAPAKDAAGKQERVIGLLEWVSKLRSKQH